ncbi:MAG: cupin domain-containing protein [Gammaproteobacteria bacterium]|nr:cupin domain-containing protein [Gammaproteobacteria bacterium]
MRKLILLFILVFPGLVLALDSQPVVVEELTKTTKSWDGTQLPTYKEGQPEITVLKITVQPNVELPWHTHPIINAGVMIKGKLTVITKSGKKHELVTGDTIVEVIGKIHRGINNGTEPAEIIVFYAGVVETPLTVKVE